jgi:uncharacterized membrane protein YgcG
VSPLRSLLLIFFLFLFASKANALTPQRPEFGVLDQSSVFPLSILKVTERLVTEHERLTQEQISILIQSPSDLDRPSDYSKEIFDQWRRTSPRPPNAVLVFVDAEKGALEIQTGHGLDPVLSSAKVVEIRKEIFKPEWNSGTKARAVVLAFVEVLRALESPLISGGEAIDGYERAGFSGGWSPTRPSERSWVGWIFALIGVAVAGFVLVRILIGETHYTADGWFRVPAIKNLKRLLPRSRKPPTFVTGGGVSGHY